MKKETEDTTIFEGTWGRMREIEDFLPRPEELVFRPKPVEVTLTLSEDSLDYYRMQADRLQVSYQAVIRAILDEYAHQQSDRTANGDAENGHADE